MASALHIPADEIRQWRLEQLETAGYPEYESSLLSGRFEVDLHLASAS